jgi:acetyl-CoA acetyltransferase
MFQPDTNPARASGLDAGSKGSAVVSSVNRVGGSVDGAAAAAATSGTSGAARVRIGPSIEQMLAVPQNVDGLTPLQAADCFLQSEEFYVCTPLIGVCATTRRADSPRRWG